MGAILLSVIPAPTNRFDCANARSMADASPSVALCVTCVYNRASTEQAPSKCMADYNGAWIMNQVSMNVKCEGYLKQA